VGAVGDFVFGAPSSRLARAGVHEKGEQMADDATRVAPHVYRVLFENERVRVLEVTMQPGERSDMHSHPDYFAYVLGDGGAVRFTMPSGETAELELPAGASMWREAEEHATENVGRTVVRAIFLEPK
jgi:quercetin dioxygenase-like cupin family protein